MSSPQTNSSHSPAVRTGVLITLLGIRSYRNDRVAVPTAVLVGLGVMGATFGLNLDQRSGLATRLLLTILFSGGTWGLLTMDGVK